MPCCSGLQRCHLSPTIVDCYISAACSRNEGDYLNKVLEIREADFGDAAQIAAVKRATWPDEEVHEGLIQKVLSLDDHRTQSVVCDGVAAGFASGFLTKAATHVLRWELDLLAVHPDFRGRGFASKLVAANTEAGFKMGAKNAHGLVQIENIPSQRAFARAGYKMDPDLHSLYISKASTRENFLRPEDLHLIQVYTMNYCGLWIEGGLSYEGFRYAQEVCQRQRLDLVGAVIPHTHPDGIRAARESGFLLIGQYQWWTLNLSET